ncbi:hypothetical protein [Hymenobacter chitinivorans]|uniref:Uncharacterized protein n=1 Tax=Hymenobacter chitinivorans DSM 11115 TaxID=1121954 RepID=A0A2M9BRB7_9BACT|nr:hypothetical protein [Hymenobacter chitinivorans]PJJ60483.1 hypothetical protein CLV45_1911 [Hymenobacter chitinivorans DSM 11115]
MKILFRTLSLTLLLAFGSAASAPVSRAASVLVLRSGVIDTQVKIAVRKYASVNSLGTLTYVYDSETDFRVYSGSTLIEYGYADFDGFEYTVYIGGVDYTHYPN